jgi:hypothetical protein
MSLNDAASNMKKIKKVIGEILVPRINVENAIKLGFVLE